MDKTRERELRDRIASKLAALQAALETRRRLIDEWKQKGRPTPQELLDRIDENDRHILDLRQALLAEGPYEMPQQSFLLAAPFWPTGGR